MDKGLQSALMSVVNDINSYIDNCEYFDKYSIKEISQGLRAYFSRGGKRIRPAIAMWSCGICGGDPKKVIPAASGLEACHTWTLIHDDIIDNDDTRRGGPSVHVIGKTQAEKSWGKKDSEKYGETYSILIGDMLQGISVSMILDSVKAGVDPKVAIEICKLLESDTALNLIEGELLDVQFEYMDIKSINPDLIYKMIWGKTGVLIKYAAVMGAMIGLNTIDMNNEKVKALGDFAINIGLAFQLRDDVLGLIADEKKLGKPVGSDIVEGKKTLTAFYALETFSESEKEEFLSIFGNPQKAGYTGRAVELIKQTGAIEKTSQKAENLTHEAIEKLSVFPDNEYKSYLSGLAEYMLMREK
ncbi:MAG: polyprenyl synthetase family protein [Abditibacteriota bacterium]|nr:polyprenyl synthetase family protein [Abditibacteriota bacterium]